MFSEWEMLQTNVIEKIKTYILCLINSFPKIMPCMRQCVWSGAVETWRRWDIINRYLEEGSNFFQLTPGNYTHEDRVTYWTGRETTREKNTVLGSTKQSHLLIYYYVYLTLDLLYFETLCPSSCSRGEMCELNDTWWSSKRTKKHSLKTSPFETSSN